MLLFRSEETVTQWCEARGLPKRPSINLDQLWYLAVTWYENRLSVESRRPGADEMVEIFARVGLEVLGIFPEITLADKTVGRRHAYVRSQHGLYTVEDLNALNKTRLNGVTLTPHEEHTLKDGDILRFGSVEVRFELR